MTRTAEAPSGYEVSIVIPAYNAAGYLDSTVRTALSYLDSAGIHGEVVVADDGSVDGTAETLTPAPNLTILRLPHGGKGAAVRAGMLAATGRIRAFTDADLPYGLDALPLAMTYIRERRFHAVVGDRTLPGSSYASAGLLRTVISEVASFTFRTLITGGNYDTQCGFKVFRGDVAAELFRMARIHGFAVDVELIYLVLKYRLDLKRIPVRLVRNAPSTVHVVRDSARAVMDIATIRLNLARGRYRSPVLVRMLEEELRDDVAAATRMTAGVAASGAGIH